MRAGDGGGGRGRGLTLLDVVVVLVVVAVLATVALSRYGSVVDGARDRSAELTARAVVGEAVNLAALEGARVSGDLVSRVAGDTPGAVAGAAADDPRGVSVAALDGGRKVAAAVGTGTPGRVVWALGDPDTGQVEVCRGAPPVGTRVWAGDVRACQGTLRTVDASVVGAPWVDLSGATFNLEVADLDGDGFDEVIWPVADGTVPAVRIRRGRPGDGLDLASTDPLIRFPSAGSAGSNLYVRAVRDDDGTWYLVLLVWSSRKVLLVPVDPGWSGTVNDPAHTTVTSATLPVISRLPLVADLTGDGVGDLLLGSRTAPPGRSDAARAVVLVGPLSTVPDGYDLVNDSTRDVEIWAADGGGLPDVTSMVFDIDGDGSVELLVGQHNLDIGGYTDRGRLVVCEPPFSAGQTIDLATWPGPGCPGGIDGPPEDSWKFGSTVGTAAADVDIDGTVDLIADHYASSAANAGALSVFSPPVSGNPTADTVARLLVRHDPAATAGFGYSVAVGDLTGDGVPEVIAGGPYAETGYRGRVWWMSLDDGALDSGVTRTLDVDTPWATRLDRDPAVGTSPRYFGYSVAAGDLDGDGYTDLLILQRPDATPTMWRTWRVEAHP